MPEISKTYDPQSVEDKWYAFWLKQNCFVADPKSDRPAYSIVIPPPNVTGVLHMGHVLNNSIQDILSRKARMDGKEVLWLPGTDHAGIATEGMVSKQIWNEEKKSKRDLGREEFIRRVWAWKEKHGGIIIEQLKKLGCSCDWSRERFTMDGDYVRCVQKVFVELYKKGLIYRGKRMVNWCPATLTALSDEEVVMKQQNGSLYYFKVEVAEEPGRFLTIATTRPETIPGDTAVAVNPKDKRYSELIGKHILRPLPAELPREQKLIPILGDEHVDFEFGTGVLKVTPAHDKADFEIWTRARMLGARQGIPELRDMQPVDIMNPDATMNALAGKNLAGLDRFKARKVAVENLKELGLLEKEEPYQNNIGYSDRADVPVEPRLSEQWFLKYPGVDKARACVALEDELKSAGAPRTAVDVLAEDSAREGAADGASAAAPEAGALPDRMRFFPERWAKVYDHWMGNIQDWCISRQLWWGHRVPVWRHTKSINEEWAEGDLLSELSGLQPTTDLQSSTGIELSLSKLPGHTTIFQSYGLPDRQWDLLQSDVFAATVSPIEARELEAKGFTQDPDVLDTWFSSWLWPFATMGWPEQTDTLKKFYPTTDLVTAPEIIFFWVARMIMAGFEFMGGMPFRNVYFTGIIRDKQGRKMSKSLGNSPDPLDLIAEYGADAVRFGTMRSAPLGQDVMFDKKDVELGRNFCNKLWNACRFRQMMGQPSSPSPASNSSTTLSPETGRTPVPPSPAFEAEGEIDPALLSSDDQWILGRLDQAIREMDATLAEYKFSDATATLHRFFWNEYCDWYVEASKAVLHGADAARKANTLAVIDFVLSHTLRLFHPFLPFIMEDLWHGMGYNLDLPVRQGGDTIMFAHWPKPLDDDFKAHYGLSESVEKFVAAKYELVTQGRNLRSEARVAANKKVRFILKVKDPLPTREAEVIKLLLNAETLDVDPNFAPVKGTPSTLTGLGELFLSLEGLGDVEAEKSRLKKELAKIEGEIEKVQSKLNNPNFAQKVPPAVLEDHKKRLADGQAKKEQIQAALRALE